MKRRQFLALFVSLVLLLGMMPAAHADVAEAWEKQDTFEPTCTSEGYEVWHNFISDEYEHRNVQPALGHDFHDDWSNSPVAAGPTCTSGGLQVRYCHRCQASETREVGPLGHDWGEWYDVEPWPTCTEGGKQCRNCRRCQAAEYRDVPALGHDFQKYQDTTPATCTAEGVRTWYCGRCQATKTEAIPALGHAFGDWVTTTQPTCTAEGVQTKTCSRCGATQTQSVAALGHSQSGWQTTKEATCTEAGTKESSCTRCGQKYTESIPALGHSWGGWTVTKQPTCTAEGVETSTCSRCGAAQTRAVAALGHSQSGWSTVKEPTCTEEGRKESKCTRCGETYTDTIPALGHAYGSWTTTREPTCAQPGEKQSKCSRCGATVTDSIPTTAHTWGEWYVLVEAGDWETGTMERKCQVCGATEQKPYYKDGTVLPEDRGDAMQHLQDLLNENGFDCGKADGIYGPKTQAAVEAAEQAAGHPATGIGWTGLIAWLEGGAKPAQPEEKHILKGVEKHFTGVCEHNGWYYPTWNDGEKLIWEGSLYAYFTEHSALAKDPEFGTYLKEEPTLGETYYFELEISNSGGYKDHNIDFSQVDPAQVDVTMGGFIVELLRIEYEHTDSDYDGADLYFKATYVGGENDNVPHPGVTVTVTVAPDAGVGKRYVGAEIPYHFEVTNTGNWPVYVDWLTYASVTDAVAPNDHSRIEGMGCSNGDVTLLNPGESYEYNDTTMPGCVGAYEVEVGYMFIEAWAWFWYYNENGEIGRDVENANEPKVDLTYPEGEEPEKKAELTLIYEGDCYFDGGDWPEIPTTEDTFDADDAVYANHTFINSGDVPLYVVRYYEAKGVVTGYEVWTLGKFDPSDYYSDGLGYTEIGKIVEPGTETDDLLGTATVSFYYVGYDPDTYVDENNPGTELCRTQTITRTWKVRKPGAPGPWPIPEESQLKVTIEEVGSSSDPAGYQLSEYWDTKIKVENTGLVDLDDFTLRVDFVSANQAFKFVDPSLGDWKSWYEYPRDIPITAGEVVNLHNFSPHGHITEEDVARGYVYAIATVTWIDPDSGNERTAKSDPLTLPVISKTGLLVKKGIAHKPENGEYFRQDEAIDWTLTVTNNSKEPIRNVVVTDQGLVVGSFAEIAPGATEICTVPPHIVTEYEATVVGEVINKATATGEDIKGISHTWPSNPVKVPTNEFSPTPLPPPYEPGKTPDKDGGTPDGGDGDGDPLPPGTPETPEHPGTPGGGMDPLGPVIGVKAGATVYKTTAHLPANGEWYELGETVDYIIRVKNIGEVPLENLKLYDSLGGLLPIDTLASLAPGEEKDFTFAWTVTDKNIDTGYVVNSATLTYTFSGMSGTPMKSNPVYVKAGEHGFIPDGDLLTDKDGGPVKHFPGLDEYRAGHEGGVTADELLSKTGLTADEFFAKYGMTADDFLARYAAGAAPYCALEIKALNDDEIRYDLHTCVEHLLAVMEAEKLEAKEAAGLWREEIRKLYEILYEAGDDEGKAVVMNDQIMFWAYAEVFSGLYQDDEALCGMLRLRCTELCCMINTAPARLPDSLTGDYAMMMGLLTGSDKCARVIDEDKGNVTIDFDEAHAKALTDTVELLRSTSPYAADEALTQAQAFWATELDKVVNATYKAADRESRKVIAAWRMTLDKVIGVRHDLLDLLYEDEPAVPAEAALNLYRDALLEACGHK